MSFREKSAWFVLIGLLATFGVFYFFWGHGVMQPGMEELHWFLMAIVGFVLIQVVLHIAAAVLDRQGARAPKDEREQLIGLKAARNAGAALAVGVVMVPVLAHLAAFHGAHVHAGHMILVTMGALFLSEVVRAASKIIYYRLGR